MTLYAGRTTLECCCGGAIYHKAGHNLKLTRLHTSTTPCGSNSCESLQHSARQPSQIPSQLSCQLMMRSTSGSASTKSISLATPLSMSCAWAHCGCVAWAADVHCCQKRACDRAGSIACVTSIMQSYHDAAAAKVLAAMLRAYLDATRD